MHKLLFVNTDLSHKDKHKNLHHGCWVDYLSELLSNYYFTTDEKLTWALIQSNRVFASLTDNDDKHDSKGIVLRSSITSLNLNMRTLIITLHSSVQCRVLFLPTYSIPKHTVQKHALFTFSAPVLTIQIKNTPSSLPLFQFWARSSEHVLCTPYTLFLLNIKFKIHVLFTFPTALLHSCGLHSYCITAFLRSAFLLHYCIPTHTVHQHQHTFCHVGLSIMQALLK